MTSSARN